MPDNTDNEIPPQRPEWTRWDSDQINEFLDENASLCESCESTRLLRRVDAPAYAHDTEYYWYSTVLRRRYEGDNDVVFSREILNGIHNWTSSVHMDVEFEALGSSYDFLCDDCYDERCRDENEAQENTSSDYVHSYGYRPSPIFFDVDASTGVITNRRIFTPEGREGKFSPASYENSTRVQFPVCGFELETSDENGELSYNDCARYINDMCGSYLYMKEDGSVSDGFEIVTHPHTLSAYNKRQELWDALNYIRGRGWRSWKSSSSCGLHIHINNASFGTVGHAMMFLKFIFANRDPLVRFAGRDSSYARFDYDSFVQRQIHVGWHDNGSPRYKDGSVADVVKKRALNDNRYLAVNAQNANTYELRFFKGSLNPKTVRACLEFTFALHEYTKGLTSHDVLVNRALTWRPFLAFIRSKSKEGDEFAYRHLYDRLLLSSRNPDSEFISSHQDD